jgi:glycosyltransferase involved in cell wall biosynthesis
MATLFSIITANYNNGRYLPALIKSMQAQTYANWELIIADDASADDSVNIIEQYIKTEQRIKLARHYVNMGAGGACKTAMDVVSGALIGKLDADDALVPEALQVMLDAHIQHPLAAMINSHAYDCDADLNVVGICPISNPQPPGVSLIREMHVGNFVTFKRTAYLKTLGFENSIKRAVDHDIYLKLEEVGPLYFVDQPLYLYRRHQQGISQGDNGMKAANFSLKTRMNAYERRKASGFVPNLTNNEYKQIATTYFQRIANELRLEKKFWAAVKANYNCVLVMPSYLLRRPFWSSLFYSVKGVIQNK